MYTNKYSFLGVFYVILFCLVLTWYKIGTEIYQLKEVFIADVSSFIYYRLHTLQVPIIIPQVEYGTPALWYIYLDYI